MLSPLDILVDIDRLCPFLWSWSREKSSLVISVLVVCVPFVNFLTFSSHLPLLSRMTRLDNCMDVIPLQFAFRLTDKVCLAMGKSFSHFLALLLLLLHPIPSFLFFAQMWVFLSVAMKFRVLNDPWNQSLFYKRILT